MAVDLRFTKMRGSSIEVLEALEYVSYPHDPGDPRENRLYPYLNDLDWPLLGCIDYYGYTIFNHIQMEPLLKEWQRLRGKAETPEELVFLDKAELLLRRCQNDRRSYICFAGE